jgi:head-tail adaptor
VNAGSLSKRLQVQKPAKVPDGIGGKTVTGWENFGGLVWGNIKLPRMQTAAEGGDVVSVLTREIEIRYLAGVKINWRVRALDEDKNYKIIHVYDIGLVKTILVCIEVGR